MLGKADTGYRKEESSKRKQGWKTRKYDAFKNFETEEEYDTAVREHGYWTKYNGKTSDELYGLIDTLEEGEEKDWLGKFAGSTEYNEKISYDLNAGQADIDSMHAQLNDLLQQLKDYRVQSWETGGYDEATTQKGHDLEDQINALKQQIHDKEIYFTNAKWLQDGKKLDDVANPESENYDPDFDQYTGYVSTQIPGAGGKLDQRYGDLAYEYINGADNGMRNEISKHYGNYIAYSGHTAPGVSPYEASGYDLMTPEEIDTYNYYYAKEGKEKADQYLAHLQETLNARIAGERYENYQDNFLGDVAKFGTFLSTGLDQFSSGIDSLFSGSEEYKPTSSAQFLASMVREDMSPFVQTMYDLGTTVSNMAPTLLTSTAAGLLNPVAGTVTGLAMMGSSVAGNSYQDAINRGYSKKEASGYAALTTAAELSLQYVLGGIGKLGGTSAKFAQALNGVDNAFWRILGKLGGSVISEATEEGLQEILNPIFENIVLHNDAQIDWEEVAYSALLGGLSGGILNLGDIAKGEIAIQKQGQVIQNAQLGKEDVNAFIQEGLAGPKDSEAYQIAEHLQQKQASGKEISGQELARLQMENARVIQAEEAERSAADNSGLNLAKQIIVGDLGENGNKLLDRVYREAEDAGIDTANSDFARGFLSYYNAGFTDNSVENVKWKGQGLTDLQKTALWKAGRQDAIASLQKAQKGKFVVYGGKEAGLVKNQYSEALQKTNPGVFVAADKLGKQLGTRVEIKPLEDGVNGNIQDGVVTLNSKLLGKQNVEEVFLGTLAHEAFHRMMEVAPTEARAFRDYVAKVYSSRGSLEDTITTYIQGYSGKQTLTNEGALEEAAADYIKKFVKDTKLFSDAMKEPENQSWGRKFVESVKALIAKIKKVFTDQDARNAASIEATGKNLTEVEQAVKIWEKAMEATTEGVKTSERRISPKQAQKNTAENGGGKMSLDYSSKDVSWLAQEGVIDKKQMARFYETVANIQKLGYACPRSKSGLYMVDLGTVIAFTDADFDNPIIYRAIEFNEQYESNLAEYKGRIYDEERNTAGHRETVRIISLVEGKGYLVEHTRGYSQTVGRENRPGEGADGRRADRENQAGRNSGKVKYSLEPSDEVDSQGNQLSNGQKVYFADSKVRDAQGKLIPVYHGTGALFNEFSFDFINTHGSSEGRGFYFTDSRSMAEGYSKDSGRVMAGYLDIKKPLSNYERTISRQEVTRLIKAIDPTGDDLLANYDPTGGMGYPSQAWYNRALRDTVDIIMQNETDSDLLAEIANGGAGNAAVMQTAHDLLGYDGYIEQKKYDGASVYVALDSSQFKDLDNKNPTSSKDTRYSMEGTENIEEQVRRERLQQATEAYGDIPKGEKPAREVTVPRAVSKGKNVSYTIRTALEAGVTPESIVPKIQEKILAETFSDVRLKNKDLMASAKKWVRGFESTQTALAEWLREGGKQLGPEATARGYVLYNQLATESANAETVELQEQYAKQAIDVLTDIVNTTREAARMVQATRILKNMSPEGQFYSLQRAVEQLNRKLEADAAGFKLEKGREKLEIDQEIATKWMRALHEGDQKKAAANQEMLYKSIAQHVERNFYDKWTAWRYLSMLGNPKTIIRNLAGNLAMAPMQYTKNKIAAGLEAMVIKDQSQRTKSFSTRNSQQGRDLEAFAREDYAVAAEMLEDPGKYKDKDRAALRQAIWDYKKTFQAKWLHKWQEVTDGAMNNDVFGDKGFMMRYYSTAFAQAAQARGFTAEQIKSGQVSQVQIDGLRAYAFRQAQRATFRDLNAFSTAISKLRIPDKYGRAATVANRVLEGFLPFRVTPANVTVRAVEYSPVGLVMNTITGLIDVKKGKVTAAEAIDKIASGLTGTGVYLLGAMLAGMGALTGGEMDEDEKRKGFQNYALVIGGKTFTLDWMAPASIPLFMGAESYKCIFEPLSRGENTGLGEIYQSVASSFQPLLEMSCLSGVSSLLESLSYAKGADFGQVAYSMFVAPFLSYVSQGIPTLLSQTASITEAFSEKTYTGDIVNGFEKNLAYDLVRIAEKFPFANWRQVPRVDGWGRAENGIGVLESYLSPGYWSDLNVTKADEEIDRLKIAIQEQIDALNKRYEQVQTLSAKAEIKAEISKLQSLMNVSPDLAATKINKVPLTQEEYTTYALEKGKNNYILATAVMEAKWYPGLDDRYKAKAIQMAYEMADARGKLAAVSFADDSDWTYDYLEASTENVLKKILEKINKSIAADKKASEKKTK